MPVPVVSIAQMREWENESWKAGRTEAEVIRRVGRAVAEHALRLTQPGDLILALAGKGNNGADARAALEHFDDRRLDTLDIRHPATDFPELQQLLALRPALVIDGLFGIGINRPLDPDWVRLIHSINDAGLQVLSIDVPSGLDADTGQPQGAAVKASTTLTVGAPKAGLLNANAGSFVGRLEVASQVGLVPCKAKTGVYWSLPEDFTGVDPSRPAESHKGSFGHAGLLAGSIGYHGAAVLAARGAQRAQPGLVTLVTHPSAYPAVAAQLQAAMVHPWKNSFEFEGRFDALLAGPGLAAAEALELKETIRQLWLNARVPMIADASALEWLPASSDSGDALRVITPHPGEAARLLNCTASDVQADRIGAVRKLSKRFGGCHVVLKGRHTLIGKSEGDIFVNSSGNPWLAQGGAGDLLAGYLAGLLAQPEMQRAPLMTLRYGVWQHGAAADQLQSSRNGWIVEDLAIAIGSITAKRSSASR